MSRARVANRNPGVNAQVDRGWRGGSRGTPFGTKETGNLRTCLYRSKARKKVTHTTKRLKVPVVRKGRNTQT